MKAQPRVSHQVIQFYAVDDPYGDFSNFARFPIRLKAKLWPTVEHYFQGQKHANTSLEEAIRKAKTPLMAARMGRDRKAKPRKDWESVKEKVMLEALRAKFSQHSELKELLLSTGDAKLVEHTRSDSYWADGGDGSEKNRLGQLLMQVRQELRQGTSNDNPEEQSGTNPLSTARQKHS